MGALAGHAHRPSDVGDWHVFLPDALHEQAPAEERQAGVTVTHEDLRGL
jgi:hypothetical protein